MQRGPPNSNGFSLKTLLLMSVLIAALLPALLALPIHFWLIEKNVADLARNQIDQLSGVQQRRINRELDRLIAEMALIGSRTQLRLSLDRYNQNAMAADQVLIGRILSDAIGSSETISGGMVRDLDDRIVAQVGEVDIDAENLERMRAVPGDSIFAAWETGACDAKIWLGTSLRLDDQLVGRLAIQVGVEVLVELVQDFPDPKSIAATYIVLNGPDGDRCALTAKSTETDAGQRLNPQEQALIERLENGSKQSSQPGLEDDGSLWVRRSLNHEFGDLVMHSTPNLNGELAESVLAGYGFILIAIGLITGFFSVWISRTLSAPFERLVQAIGLVKSEQAMPQLDSKGWPRELHVLSETLRLAMENQRTLLSNLRREVGRRRSVQSKLADLANSDELTGLANRRFFMQRLAELLTMPMAEGAALLYLDLDRFKPVNDRFGHQAGDIVLKVVAERLRNVIRDQDLAARLGGDEFGVLLMGEDDGGASPRTLVERIEAAVSQPINCGAVTVRVGCSVGCAMLEPYGDKEAILKRADSAMYAVKRKRKSISDQG